MATITAGATVLTARITKTRFPNLGLRDGRRPIVDCHIEDSYGAFKADVRFRADEGFREGDHVMVTIAHAEED